LKFFHYGKASANITEKGTIDMRAAVGHLSRNIKFIAEEVDNWGGRILVTSF
jgi:hypothetical protein